MEFDLKKIKKLAKKRDTENREFRYFLKGYDFPEEDLDSIVHRIYYEVSSQVDCTACGNCCRKIHVVFENRDIEKLSEVVELSQDQFKAKYLKHDKEDNVLTTKSKPCPFLKNNKCIQYANRPRSCQSYPYLENTEFVFRLWNVISNYAICPIVFNVYEELKKEFQEEWETFIENDDYW